MRTLALVMVAGLVGVLAVSGVSGAATAGADEGVTKDSVKIGFIYSKTGPASGSYEFSDLGCKARVGRENAKGGVNGREIDVVYVDDQTSAANLTAAQDLVQNQDVFMIVNDSPVAFVTYRWLLDNGIPVIGNGSDGNYYGTPGNEDVISPVGSLAPVAGATYDVTPKIAKAQGAKKMASIGYGSSPSSARATEANAKYAIPAVGMEAVYTNTTLDFGSTEIGPVVLGIDNSGADSAYYAMDADTNLAIAQGLAQNGVEMKAQIMATGYGQALLDQPIADQLGPDVIFTQQWAPVELKSKATKQFVSDLKKYADYSGVPDYGVYTGYTTCDMAIIGLKQQGKNLDRSTFVSDLREVGTINQGGGLSCQDSDISLESFGKTNPEVCFYAIVIKDGKFTVLKPKSGSKPFWSGKIIAQSVTDATTTTTAAPS